MGDYSDYDEYHDYYENNIESGFDIWEVMPGTDYMSDEENHIAFHLFYEGFVEPGGDRDAFFDYMGMDPGDFPWEDWLEWMGYE